MREVIVTERMYKAASVFTTVFAVALIFAGFFVIDEAIGWPARGDPDPLLTSLGVGLILAAAGIYVFSLRFKTREEVE